MLQGEKVKGMARFCPFCGQKLEAGSRFCGECGHQIPAEPQEKPEEVQAHGPQRLELVQGTPVKDISSKPKKESDDRPWWLKVLCGMIVVLVMFEVKAYNREGRVVLPGQWATQIESALNLESKDVKLVKQGTLQLAPNIKIGDAFKKFFPDGDWTSFKSTDNKRIVEYTGTCTWNGKKSKCEIQFLITDDKTFKVWTIAMNGSELNTLEQAGALHKIFFGD